ncbi:MAG TPA: hypothetical protein VFB92_16900 [Vicinamibacterales bacterium]|nr:hypothetical protein [Vicinamibacterales bacterium]
MVCDDDLPVILTFIAVAALACLIPPQADTFFHLRTGQSIWQSGAIPTTELFSHTFQGHEWLNHEWLSQLLFYGLHALGGPFLLALVSGACVFIAVMVSWQLTRGASEIRLMLLFSIFIVTAPAWAVRPQALSLALLMLAMTLVIREKLQWLPILMVVWANAHGVVLLGVVIACVNALEALIWSRRNFRRALVVAVLCVAAPTVTPLGWQYWTRVAQTVSEARVLGFQEYRSAFADASGFPFLLLLAVLVSVVIMYARRVAEWDRSARLLVLTSLVIGAAAIVSIRNAPWFALVAAPAISRLVQVSSVRKTRPLRRPGYVVLAIAVTSAFAVVAFLWRDGGARIGWRPISQPALSAVRNCTGPIYNELALGGTLIWFVPEKRVFVDGRVEAYPQQFLLRVRDADLSGQYQELFEKYEIRCAVTGTDSILARALQADPAITLQFHDDRWSVFLTSQIR